MRTLLMQLEAAHALVFRPIKGGWIVADTADPDIQVRLYPHNKGQGWVVSVFDYAHERGETVKREVLPVATQAEAERVGATLLAQFMHGSAERKL